ncbi:MAG: hypothetical protein AB1451_00660 [Nitrospirota bacterium]
MVGILGALVACDIEAPSSLTVTQGVDSAPGVISGQIISGTTQKPQKGLTVEVASGVVKTDTTDANGRFHITGLSVTDFCDNTAPGSTGCWDFALSGLTGHQVTITDKRSVGGGSNQIPTEADRLAPLHLRVHIVQAANTGGRNPIAETDTGLIRMNPGVSLDVLVTADGAPVPAGVTVAAYPSNEDGTCDGTYQNVDEVTDSDLVDLDDVHSVPFSTTTNATGIATLSGLDRCQEYEVVVPAQVIGGTPMYSGGVSLEDLADGTPNKTVALSAAVPQEDIFIVATNMEAASAFFAQLQDCCSTASYPGFSTSQVAYTNAAASTLNDPNASYTAPKTGNLIVVTSVPATVDNDIGLFYEDNLADPDTDNDGTLDGPADADNDKGWSPGPPVTAPNKTVAGVTGTFDSFGSILTVVHTEDLKKNQFYQLTGTLRNNANNNLFNLAESFGDIYVSDSDSAPSATTIFVDNLDGDQVAGTGTPRLVFAEAVAGTGRVISYTDDGTTTVVNGSNFLIRPSSQTRYSSHTGSPAPSCSACLSTVSPFTSDEDKVIQTISGVPALNDDGGNDSVEAFLDVVDMQGNRFVGTTTFPVR